MNDKQRRAILLTLVEAFETYGLVFLRVALGTAQQKELLKERERLVKVIDAAIDAAEE